MSMPPVSTQSAERFAELLARMDRSPVNGSSHSMLSQMSIDYPTLPPHVFQPGETVIRKSEDGSFLGQMTIVASHAKGYSVEASVIMPKGSPLRTEVIAFDTSDPQAWPDDPFLSQWDLLWAHPHTEEGRYARRLHEIAAVRVGLARHALIMHMADRAPELIGMIDTQKLSTCITTIPPIHIPPVECEVPTGRHEISWPK